MTRRLVLVLVLLTAGLSCAAFVPTEPEIREAAVLMELPEEVLGWYGTPREATEEERRILAEDTQFEKRFYNRFQPETWLELLKGIDVSIVLSGHDLNNSIHRPERCLEAQGFKGLEVSTVDVPLSEGDELRVRRIRSYREVSLEGKPVRVSNITYFWFVGHDLITESHYERTLRDMKDRLLHGYNQRWAYFSVSSNVTDNLEPFGARDEAETDEILQKFVAEIHTACDRIDPEAR